MKVKRLLKAFLFPHSAFMLVLLPVSAFLLVYALTVTKINTPFGVFSCIIATYTLSVWCIKIPRIIRFIKRKKTQNRFLSMLANDAGARVKATLYLSLISNVVYAFFQLGLGFIHSSFWFLSLACYYISLAAMRFYLVRYTSKFSYGKHQKEELVRYRTCGWIFLVMNLALSLMIFFMVYWNRTFTHHQITTIMLAAYTFTSFTLAVINLVRYKKYNSPVFTASKSISLAAACVSMLTLEATMLTTFGNKTMSLFARRLFLGITGGVISIFIIVMAIYIIVQSNKKLKALKREKIDEQ